MSTKAVTAEVNKLTSTVSKHTSKKDLIEQAVFKATQSTKEVPPKDKHLRSKDPFFNLPFFSYALLFLTNVAILEETHILGSGEFTFQEIFRRPVAEKEMILFKTLFIVHKMLRDGAPRVIELEFLRFSILIYLVCFWYPKSFQFTQVLTTTIQRSQFWFVFFLHFQIFLTLWKLMGLSTPFI